MIDVLVRLILFSNIWAIVASKFCLRASRMLGSKVEILINSFLLNFVAVFDVFGIKVAIVAHHTSCSPIIQFM